MNLPKDGDPVIVQNITGRYGSLHTRLMLDYGTNIAAGTAPGKAGQTVEGAPVFNTVAEAVAKTGAKASVFFVPAEYSLGAAKEALLSGIKTLVIITEHIPIRDMLQLLETGRANGATIVGPNCPGLILPSERVKLGIMPAPSFTPGRFALFSRSGTLMYEIASQMSSSGLGQAVALGIGGDPVTGTTTSEWLDYVGTRGDIDGAVVVGEIGGDAEERLARHIKKSGFSKPVVAYIAGRFAPKEKKMGHAGAIIYGNYGTAESKIQALREAGARVAMTPMEVPLLMKEALAR
ncbi:MAG TPA: CoA-binding protein [Nitrososphaerales archaeon]|nr:CoA-binding protein [Nitrososphaerales archaeon]